MKLLNLFLFVTMLAILTNVNCQTNTGTLYLKTDDQSVVPRLIDTSSNPYTIDIENETNKQIL